MKKTILFAGGGTMGPVTPLLAVWRKMKASDPELRAVWAGTQNGPERDVVVREGIQFYAVPVAKFPRYPSLQWLSWPWKYASAYLTAQRILNEEKPDLIVSAGGFTAVPLVRIGARRSIPCAIHQLDAEPGLANRVIAKRCVVVTTSFEYPIPPFKGVSSTQAPTPCWMATGEHPTREQSLHALGLPDRPTVLFVGGGTGATALNDALRGMLYRLLVNWNVIHATGKGKGNSIQREGYFSKEFLNEDEMRKAQSAADLVISRAGIGSIADLAYLAKPTVFVPIPNSHQELNVKKIPSAFVLQGDDFPERLLQKIETLMNNKEMRDGLGQRLHEAFPTDDGTELAQKWMKLLRQV